MYLQKENYSADKGIFVDWFNDNYEYCYLDSMHKRIEKFGAQNIVTGLSYGINAVEPKFFEGLTVNLSMHSQDLYYDYFHVVRAVMNGKNRIKNCILTLGYYSLFYDLSMSSSKWKCLKTYGPLFGTGHHLEVDDTSNGKVLSEKAFKDFYYTFFEEEPTYYNSAMVREYTNPELFLRGGWKNLSAGEKKTEAIALCEKHNKHIFHKETFEENKMILEGLISLLVEKNIDVFIVILPFSKEYNTYINPEYKAILLDYLDKLPYTINFLDFNEYDFLQDEDFLDSDHVNMIGAEKVSTLLSQFVEGKMND